MQKKFFFVSSDNELNIFSINLHFRIKTQMHFFKTIICIFYGFDQATYRIVRYIEYTDNKEGSDQTAYEHRLILTLTVPIWQIALFYC